MVNLIESTGSDNVVSGALSRDEEGKKAEILVSHVESPRNGRKRALNEIEGDVSPPISKEVYSKPNGLNEVACSSSCGSSSADSSVFSPHNVHGRVQLVLQRWGPITPIAPHQFLMKLLDSRGYETESLLAMDSPRRMIPSENEFKSYDNDLVWAVRMSDLGKIKGLGDKGRSMAACNRFNESIVHMACRRSELPVVEYLLNESCGSENNVWFVDDFGRTPLHDACWRPQPRFDIVTLLLDKDLDLLRTEDVRGSTPLNYVREEHWLAWCAYFFHQKEKYWVARAGSPAYLEKTYRAAATAAPIAAAV